MAEKTIICTECPMGCNVTVNYLGEYVVSVEGNTCPRGREYAINEIICPKRVVTSTVRAEDGRMLSVKTERSVKKSEIFNVMKVISTIVVKAPIKIGDVVYKSISDDVDLIATDNLD